MKKPDVADIVRRQTPANAEEAPRVPNTKKPADDHELVFSPPKKRFAFLSLSLKSFVVAVVSLLVSTGVVYAALTFTGTGVTSDGGVIMDGANTISIGTSTATGITIGRAGYTTTLAGNVSVAGVL